MWISWKHEDTDFPGTQSFEQKVDIFHEQTLGWQLHIADLVANGGTTFGEFKLGRDGYDVTRIRHSGFAVLQICLSYVEMVGSLLGPKGLASSMAFRTGARSVRGLIDASVQDAMLDRLYDRARCGLYHEGRIRPGIGIGDPPDGNAIGYNPKSDMVGLSPSRLPRVLKAHLSELKRDLLDPANTQLRARFEERYDSGFSRNS